ncbi:MAG TPA: ABC transporter permease subunit, partial [Actinotalea sp.]|nr:ABC transporter permease subunit [Actinotalea sp.]
EARRPARGSTARLFRSELWLIFGRRRNWVGAIILASVPILIAVVIRTSGDSDGGSFVFGQITANGLFVALAALTVELPFFLPIAVSAIAGDSVAGEANLGTLRYLLVTPVHRARLVLVKLGGIAVFTLSAVGVVAVVGALIGVALFGAGGFVTLSGTTLGFWAGLGRLALVCLYLTACLVALGAIGLFVSTLTEQPIAAGLAVLGVTVVSQILDQLSQL